MSNHTTHTIATIRRHMKAGGCSPSEISGGIEWAKEQGFVGAREGYVLAMSRALYSDDALEAGARFAVETGHGPRA